MAEPRTKPTRASVRAFIDAVENPARRRECLKKLGPHKTGVSCRHIKRLSDVDLDVLDRLVRASVKHMNSRRTA